MIRWVLPLLLGSLTATAVLAADLTVSPGQSIASALSRMASGDTLTIQGGTYDANELRPPSGVTVQGAPGQTVQLRAPGSAVGAFYFGSTHVTIKNLRIDGGKNGIWIEGSDNTIADVTITNPTSQGVTLFCAAGNHEGGCQYGGNTLRNVNASGAGMGPRGCLAGGRNDPGLCHGVYAYSSDNRIIGGAFERNSGFGIQTYGPNTTIQQASMRDNVAGGLTLNGARARLDTVVVTRNGGGAPAVWVIGPGSSLRTVCITDNRGAGLALKVWASGTTVDNVLSRGNHPDLINESGSGVSVSGSGVTCLIPDSPSSAPPVAQAPAPVGLPIPRNVRRLSLP